MACYKLSITLINLYLCSLKQQQVCPSIITASCELHSKICIFVV